jgi:site-specific recombinase XerD
MPRGMKQRDDGEGSVYPITVKQKNGTVQRFRATKIVDTDEHGKSIRVVSFGATKKEALERRDIKVLEYQVQKGDAPVSVLRSTPQAVRLTVAEFLRQWWDGLPRNELGRNTLKMYQNQIEGHLIPALGEKSLRLLERKDCREFFTNTLPNKAYDKFNPDARLSPRSIRNCDKVLRMALRSAVADGLIFVSPMDGIKPPKVAKKHITINKWIPQYILQMLQDDDDELRWLLAFVYGVRQSEALGLTDDCWKIRSGGKVSTLEIKQVLARDEIFHGCGTRDSVTKQYPCGEYTTKCPKKQGSGGYYISKRTKGTSETRDGVRVLPLIPHVIDVYKRHKKRLDALRKSADWKPGKGEGMDKLTFAKPNGAHRSQKDDTALWHEVFKKINETIPDDRQKLEYQRGHLSRHTTATVLAHMGVPPEVSRLILGHSDTSTTEYYTHRELSDIAAPIMNIGAFMTERKGKMSLADLAAQMEAEANLIAKENEEATHSELVQTEAAG